MSAPKGYESGELTFAERNPTTVMMSDGARARKTDAGYVIEELSSSGEWNRVGSSLSPNALVKSDDFDIINGAFSYYVDASGGAVTGQLPPATGSGQMYLIVKTDGSANSVTIAADGSDKIDGAASVDVVDQYADCLIQDFAGGFWHQIGVGIA